MSRNYKRGFTLIELLVVIAIIGILASIVLASLGSTRQKANDTTIKSEFTQLRNQMELYSIANDNNDYGPTYASNLCPTSADPSIFYTDVKVRSVIAALNA